MLNLERVLKPARLLRALTGLNRKVFETLLPTSMQPPMRPSDTEIE
jgi:hypothetical protein